MSHIKLKIKIKNLASEAKDIRFEERKILASRDRHYLKQNVTKACNCQRLFADLSEHRKTIVRNEARATNIAYAFIRGRPFGKVEHGTIGLTLMPLTYGLVNRTTLWSKVGRMIAKYGPKDLPKTEGYLDFNILQRWVAGEYVHQKQAA